MTLLAGIVQVAAAAFGTALWAGVLGTVVIVIAVAAIVPQHHAPGASSYLITVSALDLG